MRIDVDFLILGSGLAGTRAALDLCEHGSVLMITKRRIGDNATSRAQGGIAAVIDAHDSLELHVQDTLAAGAGLCDPHAVEAIVGAGPGAIEQLSRFGVSFDRSAGAFDLTR